VLIIFIAATNAAKNPISNTVLQGILKLSLGIVTILNMVMFLGASATTQGSSSKITVKTQGSSTRGNTQAIDDDVDDDVDDVDDDDD